MASSAVADANNDKIIIIGAGACGLAIAQGLKQAGIPYALHERSEGKHSHRDWSFGLHWGYYALEKLVPQSLLDGIQAAQVDPNLSSKNMRGVLVNNGETGEVVSETDGDTVYRLLRSKFRNLLLTGLDIHWNKKLVDITYSPDGRSATAHFADGTSDTGLAIIGCDGAHSAVRTHLVGREAAQLDPIGYNCAIMFSSYPAETARWLRAPPFHPLFSISVHPAGHTGWISVHSAEDADKPEEWVFSSYISSAEAKDHVNTLDRAALLAQHKALGARFADPVRTVYAAAADDSFIEHTKLQNWDPRKPAHAWDSRAGRVTLAGDGAHAMTFQRGQGLNNAIQDACEYVEAVKKWWPLLPTAAAGEVPGRTDANAAYEKEMIARGGAETQRSAEVSDYYHHHFDDIIAHKAAPSGLRRVD